MICNHKQHFIGITPGGAIALFDHTREEIEREEKLIDLGGERCTCLSFLESVREREAGALRWAPVTPISKEIPPLIGKNYAVSLSWKIFRRRSANRQRVEHNYSVKVEDNGKFAEGEENRLATYITNILRSRHLNAQVSNSMIQLKLPTYLAETGSPYGKNYNITADDLKKGWYNLARLVIDRDRTSLRIDDVSSTSHAFDGNITKDMLDNVPVTFFADAIERAHFAKMIERKQLYNQELLSLRIKEVEMNLNYGRQGYDPTLYVEDKRSASYKIKIELGHLTAQAASLVMAEYKKLSEKIRKIRLASDKRIAARHRVPLRPGLGLGAKPLPEGEPPPDPHVKDPWAYSVYY